MIVGELVIGVAHNVLLYSPVSEQPKGRLGSLFVTNYKLSFITSDEQVSFSFKFIKIFTKINYF